MSFGSPPCRALRNNEQEETDPFGVGTQVLAGWRSGGGACEAEALHRVRGSEWVSRSGADGGGPRGAGAPAARTDGALSHCRMGSSRRATFGYPFSKEIEDTDLWLPPSKKGVVDELVETVEEHGGACITGDPGVGKTSVLRALRHRLPQAGFRLTYCHNGPSAVVTSTVSSDCEMAERYEKQPARNVAPIVTASTRKEYSHIHHN